MKIDKPKYKDYTTETTMQDVFNDYPLLETIYEEGNFNKDGLNNIIGKELFTGAEEVNPEFWGDLIEALEGVAV